VGTNDLARASAFYDELLGLMQARRFFESARGVGWGSSATQPMFSVMRPFDGERASVGNGGMVALAAASEEQVRDLHARALALGGQDEGAPGLRQGQFYAAYFRDLDGNKLAAFCMRKA
jgi:predicted lactoylglutathione lyase